MGRGTEINRRFQTPLSKVSGEKKSFTIRLDKKQPVNYYMIQEDIQFGERIRSYQVKVKVDGKWKTVCEGSSVGNKRIESFETVETDAVRLEIKGCLDTPVVTNFSVYYCSE